MKKIAAIVLTVAGLCGCANNGNSESDANAAVINPNCPVRTGSSVSPGVTTEWDGKTVGFCCAGCRSAWEKKSDEEKRASLANVTK